MTDVYVRADKLVPAEHRVDWRMYHKDEVEVNTTLVADVCGALGYESLRFCRSEPDREDNRPIPISVDKGVASLVLKEPVQGGSSLMLDDRGNISGGSPDKEVGDQLDQSARKLLRSASVQELRDLARTARYGRGAALGVIALAAVDLIENAFGQDPYSLPCKAVIGSVVALSGALWEDLPRLPDAVGKCWQVGRILRPGRALIRPNYDVIGSCQQLERFMFGVVEVAVPTQRGASDFS